MPIKTMVKTHCGKCGAVQARIRGHRISETRCPCQHVAGTPVDPPRGWDIKGVLVIFNGDPLDVIELPAQPGDDLITIIQRCQRSMPPEKYLGLFNGVCEQLNVDPNSKFTEYKTA